MTNVNYGIRFVESNDLLYFRLVKLIYSLRRISEVIIELIIDIVLFLSSLLIWLSQFNKYIIDFVKYLIEITLKISELITLQNKLYILISLISVYLFYYLGNKIYSILIICKKQYNAKWSIIIHYLLHLLSPYFIFVFMIYLPLCIFIPNYYFEKIIRLWIYWIPLNKAVITLYNSLYFNNINDNNNKNDFKLDRLMSICDKYTNTDYILYILETISNRINNYKLYKIRRKSKSLMLLNSKSIMANEIVLIKKLQCWIDYFNLWLIYYLLKNYIFGNTSNIILSYMLNNLRISNIFVLNLINNFSLSNVRIFRVMSDIELVSKIAFIIKNIIKIPFNLIKILILMTVYINWRYLLISIIVLNTLLEIKYIENNDNQFSVIIEDSNVNFEISKQIENEEYDNDDDDGNDDDNEDDNDDDIDVDDDIGNNYIDDNREYKNLSFEDGDCTEKEVLNSNKNQKFQLKLYNYPSLNLIIRNYLIFFIDFLTISFFGLTLFSHIYYQNDINYVQNHSMKLNSRNLTRSLPSINKKFNKKSTKPQLMHSKTMPELKINTKNVSDKSQVKVISNLLETNLVLYWLPDSWKNYYLDIGEKLINKSSKFKNWILYTIILFGQIPQWIILLFPSFVVNIVGCVIFGFIYPLIMALRLNSNISNGCQFNTRMIQKLQAWILYSILFNLLNELFVLNWAYLNNFMCWIPFKNHILYFIILLLQFFSSILPIIIKSNIKYR